MEQLKEEIRKRIEALRNDMKQAGIHMTLMVSTDPHVSEYIDAHYKVTEYFSGCTSDNVVLIVEEDSARLWTDGRYFISAAMELQDTGIGLMKMGEEGVPTLKAYLESHLEKDMTLGFDGRCVRASDGRLYRKAAEKAGAKVDSTYAPADSLWVQRPPLACHPVRILPEELCGFSFAEKLDMVRGKMEEEGARYAVLSKLDDIMWLLNIRGADVECNPVALSYALIGPDTFDLFIQSGEVTEELKKYARAARVKLHGYEEVYSYLDSYHFEGKVLCDTAQSSDAIVSLILGKAELLDRPNPVVLLKAKKNETEIRHIRRTYIQDSVAVCRFICAMKKKAGTDERVTEVSAAAHMDALRREIPGFLDLSFPTISAWGPNAAMAHYSPSEESCSEVAREGFLLVDSGGQYEGGTTDVTRTIAMGPLTEEMKRDFTLVAISNLRLMDARFISGTTGVQLDMLAREILYRYGLEYNHGTGHGIGYILNVHEGPQSIRKSASGGGGVPFEPGMIVSDEPGVYKEGRYGIRTESILICTEHEKTEFGTFYKFEPLTFVPIDTDAIDVRYMEPSDIELLNRYHRCVRAVISPYLKDEELEWLRQATRELTK